MVAAGEEVGAGGWLHAGSGVHFGALVEGGTGSGWGWDDCNCWVFLEGFFGHDVGVERLRIGHPWTLVVARLKCPRASGSPRSSGSIGWRS